MLRPWLLVAVCTNRRPEQIEPCLERIGRQLRDQAEARGVVVSSGLDRGAHAAVAAVGAKHGLDAVWEPRPGLAVARNRALAEAPEDGVLALTDDDALPDFDWVARLLKHWRTAPLEVACIGGPILPRWMVRPPWMGPRLEIVFSLLDRGTGIHDLIPGREDAWGANASFRVAPLRAVGGFDTALGASTDAPLFADETEAQHRLAAAGHRGLYAGDVRVEHVIPAERVRLREIARRRFWAGVSMRLTRQWTYTGGAARLVAGSVEAGLAALRRRPPGVGAGLARAAAGAGVLSTPLVRRRLRREPGREARPRIAILHPFHLSEVRRGTDRVLAELTAGLVAEGHDVSLITTHDGRSSSRIEDGLEVIRNRRLPAPVVAARRHVLTHIPLSLASLCRGRFDLAHALHPSDAVAAAAWCRLTRRPAVFTLPAFPPVGAGPIRRAVLRRTFAALSAAAVPSRAMEAATAAAHPGTPVRLIAHGVDLERFRLEGPRAAVPTIFSAAAIEEPRNRVELVARGFAELRSSLPDARLVLADPYSRRELPAWTRAPSIEVRPIRGDAELGASYREAWVSILIAREEPFGLVLAESLACGTPIVGAAEGGIPDILDRDGIGVLVENPEPSAVAAALASALELSKAAGTAAACRDRAEELSAGRMVAAYEDLYAELLVDRCG